MLRQSGPPLRILRAPRSPPSLPPVRACLLCEQDSRPRAHISGKGLRPVTQGVRLLQANASGPRDAPSQGDPPPDPPATTSSGGEAPQGKKSALENMPKVEESDSPAVRAAIGLLRFYKSAISPLLPNSCRFQPTCSEYAARSYKEYGWGKGTVLTAWRLLRCNPLNPAGWSYDPPKWPPPGLEILGKV